VTLITTFLCHFPVSDISSMTALLLLAAVISAVSSKTLGSDGKGEAPSGASEVSVLSFGIIAIVVGALCFGAYTFFKRRASRDARQAEEPLLVVGD
jgi:drug/metabolite transporter (DMT)-like permease